MKHCPNCGCALEAPRRKTTRKTRARVIALTGRTFPEQRAWYDEHMQAQRGQIMWDPSINSGRFGSRGGYVTPDEFLARRLPLDVLRAAVECGDFESPGVFMVISERERDARYAAREENERRIRIDAREMSVA